MLGFQQTKRVTVDFAWATCYVLPVFTCHVVSRHIFDWPLTDCVVARRSRFLKSKHQH